jgi:hypothetical protein
MVQPELGAASGAASGPAPGGARRAHRPPEHVIFPLLAIFRSDMDNIAEIRHIRIRDL